MYRKGLQKLVFLCGKQLGFVGESLEILQMRNLGKSEFFHLPLNTREH